MDRSGALKLTTILVVLLLCVSTVGIGLQLANQGASSVASVDASTAPSENPLNTGGSSSNPSGSGNSNDEELLNLAFNSGNSPQMFMSGNYNYRAIFSSGCTGDARDSSRTTTILGVSSITYGRSVTDNVTVIGSIGAAVPTGCVDFQVMIGNSNWVTYSNDVPLVDGFAISGWYTPAEPGNYYFRAIYSGDSNYKPSLSGSCDEPLSVDKGLSYASTELGTIALTLGRSVTDNATVTGLGVVPTGSVDFQVKMAGATSWITYSAGKALVDGSAVSGWFVPTEAGEYLFRAVYSGDCNYMSSMSGDNSEPLNVAPAESEISTDLGVSEINLGQSVTDNATVVGLGGEFPAPTGTVTFQYNFDDEGWTTYSIVLLDGSTVTSAFLMPAAEGSYFFQAIYGGDSNYQASTSAFESEPLNVRPSLVVKPSETTTATVLSEVNILLGQTVCDVATVTGPVGDLPAMTGSVDFQVSYNHGPFVSYDIQNLVGGSATSVDYQPAAVGHYEFQAVYSGDVNYQTSTSPENSEPLDVAKAPTTTITLLSSETITYGQTVFDYAAVVSDGVNMPEMTGSVDFQVSYNHGPFVSYDIQNLVGGSATSVDYQPAAVGHYEFQAVYSGDSNYETSTSPENSEPMDVELASTVTTTDLGALAIRPCQSVTDNATVFGLGAGFPAPAGTILFQVSFNGGVFVTYDTATLEEGKALSDWYQPISTGEYFFRAVYLGDDLFAGSESGQFDEQLSVMCWS